jgi:hypothetical protein
MLCHLEMALKDDARVYVLYNGWRGAAIEAPLNVIFVLINLLLTFEPKSHLSELGLEHDDRLSTRDNAV